MPDHTAGPEGADQGSERMLDMLAAGGLAPYLEQQAGLRPKESA